MTQPSPDDIARAALLHNTVLVAGDARMKEATRLQRLGLLRVRPDSKTQATLLFVKPEGEAL